MEAIIWQSSKRKCIPSGCTEIYRRQEGIITNVTQEYEELMEIPVGVGLH